jgi:cytochrome oxidase Cu insertion factor (SCO1/SenC/PrrC family)
MRSTRVFLCVLFCSVSAAAFAMGGGEQAVTGLVGNVLPHPSPAADFTLTDQNGAAFRMADTRGKVVVMAFLYTHCTDVCPFEAIKVKDAYSQLGDDAKGVVFVVVTTDPKRDTPPVCAAYSRKLGMLNAWHFVGGPAATVHKVWADYGIGVTVDPGTDAVAPREQAPSPRERGLLTGLSSSDLGLAGEIAQQFGGGYDVGHSAPFWFIDKKGNIRVELGGDATPTDIVKDVRVLLAVR